MKIKLLICIFSLVHICISAQTITLEEVRVLALANSRSLAKTSLAVHSAALDERARIFSAMPSLSLGANASVSLWSASNAPPVDNISDTFSAGLNFSVTQKIFEGGRTVVQKAINKITSESAKKDALAEYFSVLDAADTAYYAVLEAAATLEAEESSLRTAVTSLSIAQIRHEYGIINRGDYLKALAEKETRENSRNQAQRNLALCISKLRALTGLGEIQTPAGIDFSGYQELIERLGNISDKDAVSLYNDFWSIISGANPSLAKADLASQKAEKNLDMEKLKFLPGIGASFSTGLTYGTENGMGISGGKLSLNATIPLDFWVISNNVEKSKIARNGAALDYLNAESQLETELQSALFSAFTYAGSALSSGRSLEYAEKHFEFVMERYRLSLSSVSDLGEATTLLINSQNNLTRARYGFLQSLSRLRSLGAIDNEERLTAVLLGTR